MTIPAVSALSSVFRSVGALLEQLNDDEWRVPSLCPGWDVQAVVAHLVGIEEVLLGWAPVPELEGFWEREAAGRTALAACSPAEVRARFAAVRAAREAELAAMAPEQFDAPSWSPVGRVTYGRFLAVRVFDWWVHEQDVRVPLGRPGHLTGPAAEMALDEVRASFGYIAGKKVGVEDGRTVTVHLTGPLAGDLSARVDGGRAAVVPTPSQADAAITTDSLTFMLLACGRIDPEAPLVDGRVVPSGDPDLAHRLATRLRFTF